MNEQGFYKLNTILTIVALVSMLVSLAGRLEIVGVDEALQVVLLAVGIFLVAFGNVAERFLVRNDAR